MLSITSKASKLKSSKRLIILRKCAGKKISVFIIYLCSRLPRKLMQTIFKASRSFQRTIKKVPF